ARPVPRGGDRRPIPAGAGRRGGHRDPSPDRRRHHGDHREDAGWRAECAHQGAARRPARRPLRQGYADHRRRGLSGHDPVHGGPVGALRLGGSRRLAGLISRYGDAIEADLPHYYPGVRMRQVWTGELTPREALNLIENLPRGSRFQAALADDDDLADEIGDLVEGRPPPPPPLTEWTADHEKLTLIADRLGELLHLTAAANSSKRVPQYRPLARPETALQRKARGQAGADRRPSGRREGRRASVHGRGPGRRYPARGRAAAPTYREVTWPSRRALRSCRSSPVCAVSRRGLRRRRPPQAGRAAGR